MYRARGPGDLVLINVKDREKGCNIIFYFQEPSLTTTNGGPRAIFQCNYLAKFLQNIDEFFYVQLHLGFGGAHHPDLAGAWALVRVLPGEFNL